MQKDITQYAQERYTTKLYDASQKISQDNIEKIKILLRFSPSSTNIQPWHFVLASTPGGKAKIARATEEKYPFNRQALLDASHVVVFASRLAVDETYLRYVLDAEDADARFQAGAEFKARQHDGRSMFVNMHKQDYKDVQHWMDKQVYLNIGQFLLGVATLGIDATPMEGIDAAILDAEFGLRAKGYSSLVAVALGYRHADDFNAKLPKSRLDYTDILTEV